jgi:hypothetical protein
MKELLRLVGYLHRCIKVMQRGHTNIEPLNNIFISEKTKLDFYLEGTRVRRHDTVLESRLLKRIFESGSAKRWNLEHLLQKGAFRRIPLANTKTQISVLRIKQSFEIPRPFLNSGIQYQVPKHSLFPLVSLLYPSYSYISSAV